MDLITQALLGATVAQAGWRDSLGSRAVWFGALLGMVPDLDLVSNVAGPWVELTCHRGFTHSVLFAPLVAPAIGYGLWRLTARQGTARQWAHMSFWALLTHPLLDVFTTYGTQLLSPLSDHRFALDGVSIIDPVYTIPLIVALVIGVRAPERARHLAIAALTMTTLYLGFGHLQAERACAFTHAELKRQGLQATDVRATPTVGNVWLWRVLARDDARGTLHIGHHSHAHPEPIEFHSLERPNDPALDKALQAERGQLYTWFTSNWMSYEVEPLPDRRTRVRLYDQRYGFLLEPTRAYWGAAAEVGPDGEVLSFERFRTARPELDREVRALWFKLWHGGSQHP